MRNLVLILMFGMAAIGVAQQAPAPAATTPPAAATHSAAHKAAHPDPAVPAKPPAPKTPEELQQTLAAALHADAFAADSITPTVQGDVVTLSGTVHSAERKGLATRLARSEAEKAGWSEVHVMNHLEVELKQ